MFGIAKRIVEAWERRRLEAVESVEAEQHYRAALAKVREVTAELRGHAMTPTGPDVPTRTSIADALVREALQR